MMIDWLNQNSGALTALLTLVYVVATLIILGVMVWGNILTRRGIQTTVDLERERSRPNVHVDIFPIKFSPHLIVKNVGATPAYDVKFEFDPVPMSISGVCTDKPDPANKWESIPFLSTGIKSLAAGREVKAFLAPFPELKAKHESLVFTGAVRYRDHGGKKYEDPINIDLGFLEGTASIQTKDVGDELEKIHKTIEKYLQKSR